MQADAYIESGKMPFPIRCSRETTWGTASRAGLRIETRGSGQEEEKDFRYLGHSIVLYATDVFHWAVLIDDKPLLRNDEKAQFRSLREARNAGFAAIRTLEHPEVHEQDHV